MTRRTSLTALALTSLLATAALAQGGGTPAKPAGPKPVTVQAAPKDTTKKTMTTSSKPKKHKGKVKKDSTSTKKPN